MPIAARDAYGAGLTHAAPVVVFPPPILDAQGFLDIMDRLLPASYLDPLKAGVGPGYELLQAAAAVFARCALAVAILDQQSATGTATGGSFATAQVQFVRPDTSHGNLIVKAGTVVTTSVTGRDFVLQTDVTLSGLSTQPMLVQAVAQSYEFNNCLAPRLTANGEVIPGDIDTIKSLITAPDYADPTITVTQFSDAHNGASADLDQLGADLGLPRQAGETDAAYRARLHQLPDTVSPGAVQRLALSILNTWPMDRATISWQLWTPSFLETWQMIWTTGFDVPSYASLPPGSPFLDPKLNTCFMYDDPRGSNEWPNVANPSGFFGFWLSDGDYRGALYLIAPYFKSAADRAALYGPLVDQLNTIKAGGVSANVLVPLPSRGGG